MRTKAEAHAGMQVRNVLQLYVDVEHTGRDAQFIEKFEQRERMGELLSALPLARVLCFTRGTGLHMLFLPSL